MLKNKLKKHWLPDSLFARMSLILLCGLIAAQLLSFKLQWQERGQVLSAAYRESFFERIAETVRELETTQTTEREALLSSLKNPDFHVTLIKDSQVFAHSPRGKMAFSLSAKLGSPREMRSADSRGMGGGMGNGMGGGMGRMAPHAAPPIIDLRLNDGQWIRVSPQPESSSANLPQDLFLQLLLSLGIVLFVVILAVHQATKPIQQLAHAVDIFGRDIDAPPLPESGMREARHAAQAFNQMQTRIKRLLGERSRALAAVSHDLRTPLTRLRLRTELVDDAALRTQMTNDLELMAQMIEGTLAHLRGLEERETTRKIDINALLHSLVEDAALLGRHISLEGVAKAPYRGKLSGLRRALQNLIDNAAQYAQHAKLSIIDSPDSLKLSIEDDGPGIPESEFERVLTPFYRLESRTNERENSSKSTGLGLSIVQDVALLHGGKLTLANRPQGGLRVTLFLPR